jgi:hypothetical protein
MPNGRKNKNRLRRGSGLGDILSIRVMAQTLNEEDVARAWPALCTLVWPQWTDTLGLNSMRLAGPAARTSPVERILGRTKHGVLELAQGLEDISAIGEIPPELLPALQEPAARIKSVSGRLNKALSDWKTQEANLLAGHLEDALDAAERAVLEVIR